MRIEIKVKNGPHGKWKLDKIADIGKRSGEWLQRTPVQYVWELELALNSGLTVYEAESVHARAGRFSAPIYRIDVINDNGLKIL